MKRRYFETFYNVDPMVELSEAAALESGTYVLEEGGPIRCYRRVIDGELDSVVYAGFSEPAAPLADMSDRGLGVRAEIHSPPECLPHGGHGWRTWHVSPTGAVRKILEHEYERSGHITRENLRDPDGNLVSYTIYHYKDGDLIELITHAPDGAILNRQDA